MRLKNSRKSAVPPYGVRMKVCLRSRRNALTLGSCELRPRTSTGGAPCTLHPLQAGIGVWGRAGCAPPRPLPGYGV